MSLDYNKLSKEYEYSIFIQKSIIERNRDRLKKAREKSDYKEIKRLNSLLKVLYEEKWELELAANEMKKYIQ